MKQNCSRETEQGARCFYAPAPSGGRVRPVAPTSAKADGCEGRGIFFNCVVAITTNLFWFSPPCQAEVGTASWYSTEACRVNPDPACPTASGASLYDLLAQGIPYAAAWTYPFGTRLRVCATDQTTDCTSVVVLDRGPAKRLHRLIDLNPESFAAVCGRRSRGVCRVAVEVEQ